MLDPKILEGKTISKVMIGRAVVYINFSDGTSASVAHDGDRINMIYHDDKILDLVKPEQANEFSR